MRTQKVLSRIDSLSPKNIDSDTASEKRKNFEIKKNKKSSFISELII